MMSSSHASDLPRPRIYEFICHILAFIVALFLCATSANAHSQSYGYLTINAKQANITGKLELAVRDVDQMQSLDSDGDGTITWGDIRRNETAVAQQLLSTISLSGDNKPCPLIPSDLMINSHGGETYLVAPFATTCAAPITLTYTAMFATDAQHRGLVSVTTDNTTQSFVMAPDATTAALSTSANGAIDRYTTYIVHGMRHLWAGYDHMLFLVTLLLATSVLNQSRGFRHAFIESVKLVSAFTASHAVSLALSVLGLINVPVAVAESLIAVTIVLAALNNIWPVVRQRIWLLALAFGLIHGLGFANILSDLGTSTSDFVLALLSFNLGIEAAQITVVIVVLPLLTLLGQSWFSRPAFSTVNVAISVLGAAWFASRAFGLPQMPF